MVTVVSRLGCPSSVYAEANELDASGTVVDLANAVLSALAPGQRGEMEFDTFNDRATKAQITKVNCL